MQEKKHTLAGMTLAQKVGQLFMVGFHGDAVDDQIRTLITGYHAGNVVLFRRNFSTRERIRTMTAALQELATATRV